MKKTRAQTTHATVPLKG